MLTRLFRTKVAETADAGKRNQLQEKLHEQGIDFKIKVENINQRNAVDAARMGQFAAPKFVYSFWVKRAEEEVVLEFLNNLMR